MPAFDRLLTNPPADEVVRVMLEAVDTANQKCRVGLLKPNRLAYERYVAGDFARQAEGMHLWLADGSDGTTYPGNLRQTLLGLAWWTAPQGERRVKVVGRRTSNDGFYGDQKHDSRFGPPEGGWPGPDHRSTSSRLITVVNRAEPIALAGYAALVTTTAAEGDEVARDIVRRAAEQLLDLVAAARPSGGRPGLAPARRPSVAPRSIGPAGPSSPR